MLGWVCEYSLQAFYVGDGATEGWSVVPKPSSNHAGISKLRFSVDSQQVEVSSRGGDVGVGGARESGGDGESQEDADEVLRGKVVCCRHSRVVGLAGLRPEE
jgi:hypothetical protein